MKNLKYLILLLILFSCKEKTFADDIVLNFPKNEKLTTQKFNEDGNEMGTNLIYFGKIDSVNIVKYYLDMFPEPPPSPKEFENKNDYHDRIAAFNDSIKNRRDDYFRTEEIPFLSTLDNLTDSLSNKTLSIIVKQRDTIPLYKKDYNDDKIKKHKAFPIFIKNISGKTLKIPIEFIGTILYVKSVNKYQMVRNSNYQIMNCLQLPENEYFKLNPNEIMIFAFPHLQKGKTRKAKIIYYNAESKEFDISIDEKIISSQREGRFLN
jgi:hypothetical protein